MKMSALVTIIGVIWGSGCVKSVEANTPEIADPDANAGEPANPVSFSKDILPLIKKTCTKCHERRPLGIKLTGTGSDYQEILRYVSVDNPEGEKSLLWWASGNGDHLKLWSKDSAQYDLVLRWIQKGAENN